LPKPVPPKRPGRGEEEAHTAIEFIEPRQPGCAPRTPSSENPKSKIKKSEPFLRNNFPNSRNHISDGNNKKASVRKVRPRLRKLRCHSAKPKMKGKNMNKSTKTQTTQTKRSGLRPKTGIKAGAIVLIDSTKKFTV
jgi:hypothetical protein